MSTRTDPLTATWPVPRHGLHRLLEGQRAWGTYDRWPSRHGMSRCRLVVYPPGTSAGERRRLRLWRGWPLVGAPLWVAVTVIAARPLSATWAMGLAWVSYVGGGLLALLLARRLRHRTRVVSATLLAGDNEPTELARHARLESCASLLLAADALLEAQQIDPVQHEVMWAHVYSSLP